MRRESEDHSLSLSFFFPLHTLAGMGQPQYTTKHMHSHSTVCQSTLSDAVAPIGLFFLRFAEISQKREPNAAGPIVMIHKVATLVHLMKSSKPEPRTEGIRFIVLLGVP